MDLDNSGLSAREKVRRVVVGLAIEYEIYNRRDNPELRCLYSKPNIEEIRSLHERLIASDNYRDREVALWLGLVIEQPLVRVNVEDIAKELQEMEFILLNLMRKVDEAAQTDLNNWMNYIINAGHSLVNDFWMDAKIDMNMALHSSRKESIERVKSNLQFTYEVGLLQEETSRLFKQLRDFPVVLDLPEEHLDIALGIQSILLDLMDRLYLERVGGQNELLPYVVQRLNTALRYVLQKDAKLEHAEKEIRLALSYIEEKIEEISDEEAAVAEETQRRIKALSTQSLF